MNNADQFRLLLSIFAAEVPVALVCLVAGVVILPKWQQAPRASLWALAGFGIALVLCILIPVGQTAAQSWAMQSHVATVDRAAVFAALAIVWSVLRAVSYLLLLVAIYAGRTV
jgi:hypothetical protein